MTNENRMGGINMIQEDYVSFEIAKLLKEKGFDVVCETSYYISNKGCENTVSIGDFTKVSPWREALIAAPTLQMAIKWLREVHNLHIDIDPSEGDWNPTIIELEDWTCAVKFNDKIPIQDSYEEACEAAIKYCLENLIK